ncbi:MAG: 2-hydroxyacid dehydrogenase [Candidatus Izemoplasmatales bacterium]|nr:2-hydroxyacid dehydrogenase [Candidatus Izemoplasmatales bacterium]
MKTIAFFDTKPYDKTYFNEYNKNYKIKYFESKLNENSVALAKDADAVIAFVNDTLNEYVINQLADLGVKVVAMRSSGYNNVDVKAAFEKIHILRVPAYSPHAVAELAMTLLLSLNRKVHKAYNRTRDFNFSLSGLVGFDMIGKTIGVIGTGRIGQVFIKIAKGFSMNVIAYDPYPNPNLDVKYVPLEELFKESDILSLHCPLTEETKYIINESSIESMKDGVIIINTSRGGLIESNALLSGLKNGKIKAAGLDVYEEEADIFFEDFSDVIIKDDVLSLLVSLPNVIITSHQGFLTEEALSNIASTTLENLDQFFSEKVLENEVCYLCKDGPAAFECRHKNKKRCF